MCKVPNNIFGAKPHQKCQIGCMVPNKIVDARRFQKENLAPNVPNWQDWVVSTNRFSNMVPTCKTTFQNVFKIIKCSLLSKLYSTKH